VPPTVPLTPAEVKGLAPEDLEVRFFRRGS
jgi:hypothetical protein